MRRLTNHQPKMNSFNPKILIIKFWTRARVLFFASAAQVSYEHMAVASEGGMSLRLRGVGVSKVQASGPFYLSIVQRTFLLSEASGIIIQEAYL